MRNKITNNILIQKYQQCELVVRLFAMSLFFIEESDNYIISKNIILAELVRNQCYLLSWNLLLM